MRENKLERYTAQFVEMTLLCILLVACSTVTTTAANMRATSTPASQQPLTRKFQDIPENEITAKILSDVYPPPQPSATPAPYPVGSSGKPTPRFSRTPDLGWNAEVIEVYWDGYGKVDQPEWLSNTVAKLAVYPDGFSDAYVTVDITAGRNAKAEAASIHSDWKIYSPRKTFVIECGGGMRMYRVKDHSLVSQTSIIPLLSVGVVCSSSIDWAPNESAVSFITDDRAVYVWYADGSMPKEILSNASLVYTAWSPDSLKLSVARTEASSRTTTISVLDTIGQVLHEFQLRTGYDGARLGWLTDEVLAVYYPRYTAQFYDSRTGQFLFSWTSMPNGNGIPHQSPTVSPNDRWVFIDQGDQRYESTIDPNRSIVQKQYSLYDTQTKRRFSILNHLGNYLGFAGWSADSSTLYLISRPADAVSTSEPSTPFGLLAYNVQTHQVTSLFKDAVQVAWNADKSWAFVVFAARDEQDQLGLAGGLWKVGTDTLIGRWRISNQMVYTDPAFDTFFPAYSGPIPIAWSHDQQSVVVSDKFGRVKLLNVDGTEDSLTAHIAYMRDKRLAFRWSPDDRQLLVEQGSRAWIVDLSNR